MFSCESCEVFKNIYFEEHQQTAAFVQSILKFHQYPTKQFVVTTYSATLVLKLSSQKGFELFLNCFYGWGSHGTEFMLNAQNVHLLRCQLYSGFKESQP